MVSESNAGTSSKDVAGRDMKEDVWVLASESVSFRPGALAGWQNGSETLMGFNGLSRDIKEDIWVLASESVSFRPGALAGWQNGSETLMGFNGLNVC